MPARVKAGFSGRDRTNKMPVIHLWLQPSFHSCQQRLSWSFFPSGILLKWIILYPAA